MQWCVTGIFHAMRCAGGNLHAVPGREREGLLVDDHQAAAAGDVIQFFRRTMLVQQGLLGRHDDGFGETLAAPMPASGVDQFPDFGTILGQVGGDLTIFDVHRNAAFSAIPENRCHAG